jgi:hypothetical protein
MMEAIRSSETQFLTTTTRNNIPEDGKYFIVKWPDGKLHRVILALITHKLSAVLWTGSEMGPVESG